MNELNTVPEMKQYIKDNALKKLGMRLTMKKPEMIEAFKKLGHWKELSSKQVEIFSQNPRLAMRSRDYVKAFADPTPVATEEVETVGRSPQEILALTAPVPTQTSYDFLSSEGLPALKPTTLEPPQELSPTVSIESSDSTDDDFERITFEGITYIHRLDESNIVYDDEFDEVGMWNGSEIVWASYADKVRHDAIRKGFGGKIIQEPESDDDTVFEVIQDGIKYNVDDENKVFDEEYDEVGTYDPISKSIMLFKKEPSTATVSSASPLPVADEIYVNHHISMYLGNTSGRSLSTQETKDMMDMARLARQKSPPTLDIDVEESGDFPIEFYQGVKYYRTPDDEALDLEFDAVGRWSGGEIDFINKRYAKIHRIRVGLL